MVLPLNALIKLPWVAYLTGDDSLKRLFFTALGGARKLAHNTNYLFPLFADAADWSPRHSLLNVSVGEHALGCMPASHQLKASSDSSDYLGKGGDGTADHAQLPPSPVDPRAAAVIIRGCRCQLSLARRLRAAARLARHRGRFLHTVLRMGYWGRDAAVPFYDPRGMFQACASLCCPAYRRTSRRFCPGRSCSPTEIAPAPLLASFANFAAPAPVRLLRPVSTPEHLRRGPCRPHPLRGFGDGGIRFRQAGQRALRRGRGVLGALLFDALASTEDPDILCYASKSLARN
ncbi:MAG: hypothetical protein U0703_10615 [Anaerolineae bacterium]